MAKDRLRSRIALEERQNSRRFSSVETTNLRAMLPKDKPKTQRKPKTVRVLDPVEPLDSPVLNFQISPSFRPSVHPSVRPLSQQYHHIGMMQ